MGTPILNGLIAYNTEGSYPWHMPGHKRRQHTIFPELVDNPFSIDVTEVGDLDEFHHPTGIIKQALDRATEVYGSTRSYYLVNGSTCGVLAAISAVCKPGEKIMVARNSHKSVYHAIRLLRLKPVYVMPDWNDDLQMFGGMSPEVVKKAIKVHEDVKAVLMVSPTYEGVVSDVEKIAKIAHKAKVPLIVDAAHGAHFEYVSNVNETISTTNYEKVPDPAIRVGADIVIESLHKTLPAMTQCGILHYKSGFIKQSCLEEYLSVYQSTSPSYVFMATMEACIEKMDHERDGLFIVYKHLLKEYRKKFEELQHIHLVGEDDFKKNSMYDYDDAKLVFTVGRCGIPQEDGMKIVNGVVLGEILHKEYGQMMEMAAGNYVIAMTSVADTKEAFEALYQALEAIDSQLIELEENVDNNIEGSVNYALLSERKMTIAEAKESNLMGQSLEEAQGYICGEYIYIYPPGIPLIVPGEVLSMEILREIKKALQLGLNIKGLIDKGNGKYEIPVVKENRWLTKKKLF